LLRGTTDRVGTHSAWQAHAERKGGEFSRTAAARVLDGELVSKPSMRGGKSRLGERSTTEERPHSSLGTKLRKSLLPRPEVSTELDWGKRPQTPAPCPKPHPGSNRRWTRRKLSYPYVNESRGQVNNILLALNCSPYIRGYHPGFLRHINKRYRRRVCSIGGGVQPCPQASF
jgi:hypothetical protein